MKETKISDNIVVKETTETRNKIFSVENIIPSSFSVNAALDNIKNSSATPKADDPYDTNSANGIVYPFSSSVVKAYVTMSPYHSACINAKVKAYSGNGYTIGNKTFEKAFGTWTNCVNDENESLYDIIQKAIYNYAIYANYYIEIKKFGKEYSLYVPSSSDMFAVANKNNTGIDRYVYYNEEQITTPIYFEKLNRNTKIKNASNYVYHMRGNNNIYSDYYGYPEYLSAESAIYGNYLINYANNKNIENNGRPDFVVVFKGDMSQEELDKFKEYMRSAHFGMNNRGVGMAITIEESSNIDILDLAKLENMQFEQLEKMYRQQIIVAHGLTPDYLGISDEGRSLSGSSAIGALMHLNETHFKQMNVFFENKINHMLTLMFGMNPQIQIKEIGVTDSKTDAVVAETYIQNNVVKPEYYTRKRFPDAQPNEIPDTDEIETNARTDKDTANSNERKGIDPNGTTE